MRTITTIFFAALALSANAQNNDTQRIEITVGGVEFSGDLDSFDVGLLLGADLHLVKMCDRGSNIFAGGRWYQAETTGSKVRTFGGHVGWRSALGQHPEKPGESFYFKIAGGYYNTDIDGATDRWGFGGFASVGYQLQQRFGFEVGFQGAPGVGGLENQSWFAAAILRL